MKRRSMKARPILLLQMAVIAAFFAASLLATDHIVGDSIWTIPPSNDFYSNWSQNKSFNVGDSLVFRFEMGLYNVVQVSKREFDSCSAENPFRTILTGPVTIDLKEEGILYFICSFGNYCLLGQKLFVSVQRPPPPPPPAKSSSPTSS
ncbi:umecyanin-like [Phoenix dactylifera]|uniref:Umecyanin-like n=1 Tax=Phoenix dactylifera TaxID=42345 RepID=A0A8B7CLQ8_PHODC|nr:umecyanin-like [Phoenix dactylifera]